jgi:hypothetical protein
MPNGLAPLIWPNSVMTPAVVIRPTLLPVGPQHPSVNHKAPSGPGVTARTLGQQLGIEYGVKNPSVVIRPTALDRPNHKAPSGPDVIVLIAPV